MRKFTILFCLFYVIVGLAMSIAGGGGLGVYRSSNRGAAPVDTDSTVGSVVKTSADLVGNISDLVGNNSALVDTAKALLDSLSKAVRPAADSLLAKRPAADSLMVADSLGTDSLVADSAKKRTAGIEDPVAYEAADSMVYDAETGLVYLYGQAKVKYQDMTLDAGQISMSLDSNLVHANGVLDTAGVLTQAPVYHQGSDEYKSETMSFNFKTKKGFIGNVSTAQGNGFLHSQQSKRTSDGTLYLQHGTYSTCDAEHPHFYLALSRAKVRPGKNTVFGPAYLVVADVPLPLAIPYGFFPFNKSYSSGFIMPTYGDETSRGFYLRNGGYYFALNDHMDLKVLGEIYTKGSWGLSLETNYTKRYRYRGNFFFSYLNTVEGERNMPDYTVTRSMKLQWQHTKDPKSSPNTTFSARVNFASESYERKNLTSMYDPMAYTQSTRSSSVSLSHTFENIGLTISGSSNLTQNMRDSSIVMSLPELTISLAKFYPFRRKKSVGKEKWYEKISLAYTGNLSNSINTKEDKLLRSNLIKDWRNGMSHRIPIDATFQIFKYINVTPNISLRGMTYTSRVMRSWDRERQVERLDTTYGFYNLFDWNLGVSANTTIYGFYTPWKKLFGEKIIAIRHVIKPSVSFTYAPDFTTSTYGYTRHYVKTEADGTVSTVSYSPYSGGIYGYPNGTQQGLITMSLSNNLEMKVRSDRDSTGERKISLIDELYGALSYNMSAKTRPWSDLSTRIRLKITKSYTFSMAATFATYAYRFNEKGQVEVGDRTEWSYGRFGRFQGMSQNVSYTLDNQKVAKWLGFLTGRRSSRQDNEKNNEQTDEDEVAADETNLDPDLMAGRKTPPKKVKAKVDDDGYLAFSIPWSLTLSYGISMYEDRTKKINVHRMRYPYSFTQTFNCSGFVRLADGWNITFTSGYDFNNHEISMTTASLSRDLHCFEMSCSVVLRPYSSFNFSFRARANELADALKWDKRSSYSTNIDWY